MNLHTDGYESGVDDGAVTKISVVAFAGLADLIVVTVVFCYHFCSVEFLKNFAAHMCMLVSAHIC